MAESTLPLADLLAKAGGGNFLCSVAEAVMPLLMETDVGGLIGTGRKASGSVGCPRRRRRGASSWPGHTSAKANQTGR